jgi:predicted aspartyl protease
VAAGLAVPDELLVVTAMVNGREAKLLVDSGAQGVFVDTTFAAQDPQYAAMAQSRRVRQANGMVTKSTHGLTAATVKIGAYADKLDFLATPIAGYDGILGKRWLAETGAVIDWKTNSISPM